MENQNKDSRTLRDDRSMLDRHILPEIGAVRAVEIMKRVVISSWTRLHLRLMLCGIPTGLLQPPPKGIAITNLRERAHRLLIRALAVAGRDVVPLHQAIE